MIVNGLPVLVDGVNVTLHAPPDRVQDVELNDPAPELVHDIVLVGVVVVPESVSLTVAVYVIAFPTVSADGLGVTVVDVVLVETVRADVPELVSCLSSPA